MAYSPSHTLIMRASHRMFATRPISRRSLTKIPKHQPSPSCVTAVRLSAIAHSMACRSSVCGSVSDLGHPQRAPLDCQDWCQGATVAAPPARPTAHPPTTQVLKHGVKAVHTPERVDHKGPALHA